MISADRVISNADYHRTETQLVDTRRQSYPDKRWSKKTMAPSGFILYLGIKGKVENLDHHTLIFNQDRDQTFGQIFNK
jgi:phytoene desaturase